MVLHDSHCLSRLIYLFIHLFIYLLLMTNIYKYIINISIFQPFGPQWGLKIGVGPFPGSTTVLIAWTGPWFSLVSHGQALTREFIDKIALTWYFHLWSGACPSQVPLWMTLSRGQIAHILLSGRPCLTKLTIFKQFQCTVCTVELNINKQN